MLGLCEKRGGGLEAESSNSPHSWAKGEKKITWLAQVLQKNFMMFNTYL